MKFIRAISAGTSKLSFCSIIRVLGLDHFFIEGLVDHTDYAVTCTVQVLPGSAWSIGPVNESEAREVATIVWRIPFFSTLVVVEVRTVSRLAWNLLPYGQVLIQEYGVANEVLLLVVVHKHRSFLLEVVVALCFHFAAAYPMVIPVP